jgi:hypothetical protein
MLRMLPSWKNARYLVSGVLAQKSNTNFFRHEEEVREQVLDFLHSNIGCSENLPLHVTKTRPHYRKTLTVDQLLHRIQSEETNYKNVFLQPDHVLSKHQLLTSYKLEAVTILWPFIQTFSKYSSPELRNFLRHLPENSCLKYSCIKSTRCSTVYLRRDVLLHHWRAAIYLLAANPITHTASLSSTASSYTAVRKQCQRAYMAT